jgi:hypothetical protein
MVDLFVLLVIAAACFFGAMYLASDVWRKTHKDD